MIFKLISPSPSLSRYVRHYQLIHFNFTNEVEKPVKPYPPRPEQCIIFYPRDLMSIEYLATKKRVLLPRSIVAGQVTSRQNLHLGDDHMVLKVTFYPGALYHFTKLSLTEIADENADAESIFSREMKLLNDRLSGIPDFKTMVEQVEEFLLKSLRDSNTESDSVDAVAKILLQKPDRYSMAWLAKESCFSQRQFERKFSQRIGVSPKMFARISRFDKAFRLKDKNPKMDWLRIAMEMGYHDYQHLVKDFKDFAESLPAALIQEEALSPERFFGLSE
jgi:AraC-like DNA-binding protein